jgi:hypothetical protein
MVFALNRVWQPTTKRLAVRVAPLPLKPDRLPERIEEALTESDPRRALRVMTDCSSTPSCSRRAVPTSTVHAPGLPRE